MKIIDVMNGKKMYFVSSSKPEPYPDYPGGENEKYSFFVKASSVGSAHKFARQHLGPGVSFSTRKSSGIEQVIPEAEIYETE